MPTMEDNSMETEIIHENVSGSWKNRSLTVPKNGMNIECGKIF